MLPQSSEGNDNITDIDLHQRIPFGKWEIVDVTFPDTANTDCVIPHNLLPNKPYDVQYTILRQATIGSVYEGTDVDAKAWTGKYIVLRSDTSNWNGRILLTLLKKFQDFSPVHNTTSGVVADGDAFKTIAVSGQSSVVADQIGDTLTMVNGNNITITTNATTDTITITGDESWYMINVARHP